MDLNADAMTGTMCERIAIAHLSNVLSCCLIHIRKTGSRTNRLNPSPVCFFYDLINLSRFIRSLAKENGSRHIRAIAIQKATDIQNHAVTVPSGGLIGLMMRIRAVVTESHDRLKGIDLAAPSFT